MDANSQEIMVIHTRWVNLATPEEEKYLLEQRNGPDIVQQVQENGHPQTSGDFHCEPEYPSCYKNAHAPLEQHPVKRHKKAGKMDGEEEKGRHGVRLLKPQALAQLEEDEPTKHELLAEGDDERIQQDC